MLSLKMLQCSLDSLNTLLSVDALCSILGQILEQESAL